MAAGIARAALGSLWRRPSPRVCLLVLGLYTLIALAGYAHVLPDIDASVGGSQDPPSWHWATSTASTARPERRSMPPTPLPTVLGPG